MPKGISDEFRLEITGKTPEGILEKSSETIAAGTSKAIPGEIKNLKCVVKSIEEFSKRSLEESMGKGFCSYYEVGLN